MNSDSQNRRTLLKSTAWALPAVVVVATVPTASASNTAIDFINQEDSNVIAGSTNASVTGTLVFRPSNLAVAGAIVQYSIVGGNAASFATLFGNATTTDAAGNFSIPFAVGAGAPENGTIVFEMTSTVGGLSKTEQFTATIGDTRGFAPAE